MVAERIYGEHMVKLVGLWRHIEMQVGCYDDGAVCLTLLLRRVAVEGRKREEQKCSEYHFCKHSEMLRW